MERTGADLLISGQDYAPCMSCTCAGHALFAITVPFRILFNHRVIRESSSLFLAMRKAPALCWIRCFGIFLLHHPGHSDDYGRKAQQVQVPLGCPDHFATRLVPLLVSRFSIDDYCMAEARLQTEKSQDIPKPPIFHHSFPTSFHFQCFRFGMVFGDKTG